MMAAIRARLPGPCTAATLAVGLALGGLLVGYEPVGADPDLMYRPIKSELARSLRSGTLPFWSDRFGLGVPLVAESHVAAFYPPNWAAYGLLDLAGAYRLMMWLHFGAVVVATCAYGRALGLTPWGGALAGLSFALCGFQAIHAGHEPLYQALPYLPLALLAADRYAADGRSGWLGLLGLAWGLQLTLGHFQIAFWTGALAPLVGAWRVLADGQPRRRLVGLALGIGLGAALAAPQLALSFELKEIAGFDRPFEALSNYAFPPAHWAQPAVPELYFALKGGPEDPYWAHQATTGSESSFYIGTVPLVLAAIGWVGNGTRRGLAPWRWAVALSFALATMPRWSLDSFWCVVQLPGLGWFRCPSRYTAITSLGLALLAGRGLDRSIPARRFGIGLGLAVIVGASAFGWSAYWLARNGELRAGLGAETLPWRFGAAGVMWALALGGIAAWRRGWLAPGWLVGLTAIELSCLFYCGPVAWGWSVRFPGESPVMKHLRGRADVGLVGGRLEDLPVRAGLTTGFPYLGIVPPPPNYLLEPGRWPSMAADPIRARWFRRLGLTHAVFPGEMVVPGTVTEYLGPDPVLDRLLHDSKGGPAAEHRWRVVRVPGVDPPAHVATAVEIFPSWPYLFATYSREDLPDLAGFLEGDEPPPARGPRARSGRVRDWDGRTGVVDHDGACDLIVRRTYYPGWEYRVEGGPWRPVARGNGGLQALRLDGAGASRVEVRYRPSGLGRWLGVSTLALVVVVGLFGGPGVLGRWGRDETKGG